MSAERGVRLNVAELERELARRGLQAKQLADRAGVSEQLVCRARRGAPIAPESLSAIARALAAVEVLPGADGLLASRQ
jgi:transcriptional regulator with XRE-family HTH domain